MRGDQQILPLEGLAPAASGRQAPLRRSPAERQLAFAFEATVLEASCGAASAPILAPGVLAPVIAAPAVVPIVPAPEPARVIVPESAAAEGAARADIERAMALALGVKVEVELTRNRRTMISTARVRDALRLRLHRMFVEADGAIVEALGRYVKSGDRRASRKLGEFIESRRDRFVPPRARPLLRAEGRHYDLAMIFALVEELHFPGELAGVGITWGRHGAPGPGRRRKRTIRLGTYTHDERLIRVHPVLDQAWVPRFFVEYIVFHEMLHHVEPAREEEARTVFHTPEFRRRERAYPDYERALEWERANIGKLLSG